VSAVQTKSMVTWACEECGDVIVDGEGYLAISYADINTYRDAVREWNVTHNQPNNGRFRVLTTDEFLTYPEPPRWHVCHASCDSEPDSPDYWIGVERIRTVAEVLRWTAHLAGKNWQPSTNWSELLRDVAEQVDGRRHG
jgi:hypothetical protein